MASEPSKVVPLTCHGHSRPVTHLDFSSTVDDDQYYLMSACKDNNPMLRDGITGDWIGTFVGHKGAVWQARISSDATLAVTGSADFTALVLPLRRPNQPWFDWKLTTTLALYRKVWDTHTGENLHTFQHAHIVRAVALPSQPRPSIVATGGAEKKLRIFDLSAASRPASPNSSLPNGSAVTNGHVNGVSDKSAASYEIGPGVHGGTIKSIVWTSDPNVLVTAADDKKIRWWDLRSRSLICEFELDGVVGSCELNAAATVNPPSTASLLAEAANPTSGINGVNGSHGGINGTDRAASGGGPVLSVAAGKRVYFFDGLEPNRLAKTFEMPYEVASVALHPDQQRFVTGCSGDTWVRMHDFEDGKELELSKGHHGPIWSVSFSPDGKLYATGSEDGTIKLWKFCSVPYGLWR